MTSVSRAAPRDVVFDLGGVLVDWDPGHLLCGHLGFSRAEADRLLSEVCTREWHATLDGGTGFADGAAELARAFPAHERTIKAYTLEWEKMFAGEFRSTVRLLSALKGAGFRIHALSNYPRERIAFLYRRFTFMREFDIVVLSGLIGAQKPQDQIFEYLLERIGTRDCVFLDDRPENVAAAQACGMRAIRYLPPPAHADLRSILDAAGLTDLLDGRLPNPNRLV